MLRTVRYIDTKPTARAAAARLYAQRVDRTPGIADGARRAYAYMCEQAEDGKLTGVDDIAHRFGVQERTVYRWIADLARLDVLRNA